MKIFLLFVFMSIPCIAFSGVSITVRNHFGAPVFLTENVITNGQRYQFLQGESSLSELVEGVYRLDGGTNGAGGLIDLFGSDGFLVEVRDGQGLPVAVVLPVESAMNWFWRGMSLGLTVVGFWWVKRIVMRFAGGRSEV